MLHKGFVGFYVTVAAKEPTGSVLVSLPGGVSKKYADTYGRSLIIFCI